MQRDNGAGNADTDRSTAVPPGRPGPTRGNVLDRGVRLLRAFRPSEGALRLTELSRRTGLPKATVHRLAEQLTELGLLQRAPAGFLLGIGLFELGELVPVKLRLREAALPFMQDLYEATHETIHLGVRDGLDVIYADRIRGHAGIDTPSRVGGRLPLTCTGVGKVLLAYAGQGLVDEVLAQPLPRLTAHSVTDPGRLADELAQIRYSGVGYDRQEAAPRLSCVASPVLVHGQIVAALSISVPAHQLQPARLAPAVRTASLALSRVLSRAPDNH
ncbi:IclR family transcriptional regulator [Micromonospora sp. KC207]|uniref:IclR family transcriptional regulator n=1 Tax=Micromonospora sp. KC207 TaxID=2530377 RepID=UPI001FB69E75|nr:IclR family transcriptional regulator [Micromonospora sp. KC207]